MSTYRLKRPNLSGPYGENYGTNHYAQDRIHGYYTPYHAPESLNGPLPYFDVCAKYPLARHHNLLDVADLRRCNRCFWIKNTSDMRSNTLCKACAKVERKAKYYSGIGYMRKYGLTLGQIDKALDAQGGKCAICRKTIERGGKGPRKMHLDHCHSTGKPRGLLCPRCNSAMASFKDNPDLLRRAIEYLK